MYMSFLQLICNDMILFLPTCLSRFDNLWSPSRPRACMGQPWKMTLSWYGLTSTWPRPEFFFHEYWGYCNQELPSLNNVELFQWMKLLIHSLTSTDNIGYPFPNFNGKGVEVWELISNFIPHFIMVFVLSHQYYISCISWTYFNLQNNLIWYKSFPLSHSAVIYPWLVMANTSKANIITRAYAT